MLRRGIAVGIALQIYAEHLIVPAISSRAIWAV